MGLTLPADVVLNVVRPTDAAAIAAAREQRVSSTPDAAAPAFAASTKAQSAPAAHDADATPSAFRKFEAMMLQSFLQSMLPTESEAVYGEGLAGDMWRSMMAEQIAGVMAERGGIGVADRILAGHYGRMEDASLPNAQTDGLAVESVLHEARRMALQPTIDAAASNRSDF
ncbi:flagellar biosynthesis protein FlgJ [Aliihoeflea aestuarii]|uniref:rod-binding protein n=1 Tax=Aliihoeflea aestuarii TaxID=453840 RepID=UPI0020940CCE|nr:rod-binding protein [Aliihoeflea aestuarii]MCO6392909.1 flagellar biosynthesis protein FlgJ [Aliihoeflea aestuarii]